MAEENEDWGVPRKFWMETARTVFLALAGAILALVIAEPWKKDLDYQAELD